MHGSGKLLSATPKKEVKISMRIAIIFGYSIFFLTLVGALLQVVPMTRLLFNDSVNQLNVAALLFSMLAAYLLPMLMGYLIGSRATQGESKKLHRYNGILFAMVGYWLSLAFIMFDSFFYLTPGAPEQYIQAIVRIWPVVATIVVLISLGFVYAKSAKRQVPLATFGPYVVSLVGSIVLFFASMTALYVAGPVDSAVNASSILVLALPVIGLLLFLSVSYWRADTIKSKNERFVKSLLAVTFGLVALTLAIQLISYIPIPAISGGANGFVFSLLIGIATWVYYVVRSPDFK